MRRRAAAELSVLADNRSQLDRIGEEGTGWKKKKPRQSIENMNRLREHKTVTLPMTTTKAKCGQPTESSGPTVL